MPDPDFQTAKDSAKGPVRAEAETRDRDLRRLQGLQMLMERAAGASLRDIAEKYRLPETLADDVMTEAWKDGVLEYLAEKLYRELGPLAMSTYEAQLKMGNLDAARDVLGTIGVIQRPGQKNPPQKAVQSYAAEQTKIDSIESYRLVRQQRAYTPGARRRINLPEENK